MSAIIETNRGGTCAICLSDFEAGEPQFTHVGGESHDGFHRSCFLTWLNSNSTCPLDRAAVDPYSILTPTERKIARLRHALVTGAYAASLGTSAAVAGAGAAILATGVGLGLRAVAEGASAAEAIAETVAFQRIGMNEIVALGGVAGLAGAGLSTLLETILEREWTISLAAFGAAIATIGAGLIAGNLADDLTRIGTVAAEAGAGIGVGAAVGIGIEQLLNRRGVDGNDQQSIGMALITAAMGIFFFSRIVATPLQTLSKIALLSGCAAGILSLIRR